MASFSEFNNYQTVEKIVEAAEPGGYSQLLNYEQSEKRAQVQLQLLSQLASTLTATPSPQHGLKEALALIGQFTATEAVILFQKIENAESFKVVLPFYSTEALSADIAVVLEKLEITLNELTGPNLASPQFEPFFINNAQEIVQLRPERLVVFGIRNVLILPVKLENQVQGICCLFNKASDFTETNLTEAALLGVMLGGFLKNLVVTSQLHNQQRRHFAVLDAAVDGFLEVSHDLQITFFSKGAESLTGWKSEDVLGRRCHEVLMPHSPDNESLCNKCPLQRAFRYNAPVSNVETLIRSRDGEDNWVSCSYNAITDEQGTVTSGVITIKDIYRLKALSDELLQQAQQQESLLGVNNAINRLSNIEEIYRVSLDEISSAIGFDLGTIHAINPDTNELILMSYMEQTSGDEEFPNRPYKTLSRSELRSAIRLSPHGQTRLQAHNCEALQQNEAYMAVNLPGKEICPVLSEHEGLQSHLCVPIKTQDRTYGVLHLASRRAYAFWGSDFVLALNICKQIGVAAERARLFEEVDRLARTDALTGLYNKREFWDRVEREIRRANRRHSTMSMLLIDLDRLKWINDCFGHNQGDSVLSRLGQMIREECRSSDIAFRYGGDELCILLPDTSREEAKIAADRLRMAARSIRVGEESGQILIGNDTGITMSIGVACYPADSTNAQQLFENADAAMYRAKETGKDRSVLFEPQIDLTRLNYRRRNIENDIHDSRNLPTAIRRRTTNPLDEQKVKKVD